jgi:hypothetical protein
MGARELRRVAGDVTGIKDAGALCRCFFVPGGEVEWRFVSLSSVAGVAAMAPMDYGYGFWLDVLV